MTSLKINAVNKGNNANVNEEYVLLEALADINLQYYAIVDESFDKDGKLSNKFRHIFEFPSYRVGRGEYVVLYTGAGKQSVVKGSNGRTFHYFYWNSRECVWNNAGDTAHVIRYEVISSKKV